jgi:hypothetical protein
MKTLLLSALIVWLLVMPAQGEDRMKVTIGAMILASSADLFTTYRAIDRGATEINLLLGQNRGRMALVKCTGTGLAAWGMWELGKRKPKLAFF